MPRVTSPGRSGTWTADSTCDPANRTRTKVKRGLPVATQVSEAEARGVVEAAREADWKLPSFGKQLFLGDFRLDLIHPQAQLEPDAVEKGERFLAELTAV